jgi:hypothetical protein
MSAVQPRLPLTRLFRPRVRSVRRSFTPSQEGRGPYRLPREVRDRLATSLARYRNRDSAYALAMFLARYWSTPSRIADAFPIDRRALAEHGELDLTEKRIRNAIRALEEIGFLDRAVTSGSSYKATEDGLRRKPIKFMFGSEYAPAFIAANRRAAAARGGHSSERRAIPAAASQRPSTANSEGLSPLKGPKNTNAPERTVNLGPLVKESGFPANPFDPDSKLERALARLEERFRQSRGGQGEVEAE